MSQPAHVTFIHGLANKPAVDQLKRIWLGALAAPREEDEGFDIQTENAKATFVYWADLFYDTPLPAAGYETRNNELESSVPDDPTLDESGNWTRRMCELFPDEFDDPPDDAEDDPYERIPLPGFLKRRLMRHFVRETHDYLFDVDGIRQKIRQRVLDDFAAVPEGTRHVLVGHSQGSFIAYDVLTGVEECKRIDGFLTLGSPLGLDEIQDRLTWTRKNGFPARVDGDWVNVYDPLDVVSRPDPRLANDFQKGGERAVIDVSESNWGKWRHSATKYLKGRELRRHLRRLCDREID